MLLKAILKLIGLQPIPKQKRKPKAKRRERHTQEWEHIGGTLSYSGTQQNDLDEVPEWLIREWNKVGGATGGPLKRTLGGKWKFSEDVENLVPDYFNEDCFLTGYFRNGKKFRYMIVVWEWIQGSGGQEFFRKRKRSK